MNVTHKRLQHGVGQGSFHSAKIKVCDDSGTQYRFDYVYDCGAVSFGKNSYLMSSISSLRLKPRANSQGKQVIDALVLSHYDQDHIIGAKRLTSLYDVRRIYLPYLSPGELFLVLASQAERWRPMQIRALYGLAKGNNTLFGVNVSMVGSTSGQAEPSTLSPDLPFPRGDGPVGTLSDSTEGRRLPLSMVSVTGAKMEIPEGDLPANAELTLGLPGQPSGNAIWTLRFWNRGVKPGLLGHVSSNLKQCGFPISALNDPKGATKIVEWLHDPSNKTKAVKAYHDAINATYKKGTRTVWASHIANHISLGLYSGPTKSMVNKVRYIKCCISCWDDIGSNAGLWCHCNPWHRSRQTFKGIFRYGWLGTGDAPLGESDVWIDFKKRYSRELSEVLSVQVPHHGAAPKAGPAYFNAGLLQQPAINAVVSAGVNNRYGHPKASVIAAIKRAGGLLRLVNELKRPGFEEYLYFRF